MCSSHLLPRHLLSYIHLSLLISLACFSTCLQPMKALRASAGTSQPVLSSQQVQTLFYQVPELRDMHQSFYSGLKTRLNDRHQTELPTGEERQVNHTVSELVVGDLFLKMVSLNVKVYLKCGHWSRNLMFKAVHWGHIHVNFLLAPR